MKNTFWKTIGAAALAILMAAVFAQILVSAQKGGQASEDDWTRRRNGSRGLEGSWNTQVTIRNCQTGAAIATFPAMNTFMSGGTLQETGARTSPALRAPGHGVWSFGNGHTFSSSFQFFRFNPDGTYAGIQRVRRQIEVSRDGSSFNASATIEIFDPNGVLLTTGCASETATRFE